MSLLSFLRSFAIILSAQLIERYYLAFISYLLPHWRIIQIALIMATADACWIKCPNGFTKFERKTVSGIVKISWNIIMLV